MTVKEIITEIAKTNSFKEKYKISDEDIDQILSTSGVQGKKVLRILYTMIAKNNTNTSSLDINAKNTYSIIKTKFNI